MMDSWINVIIEWINCLDINDKTISDIDELQDEAFYNKLLSQINYNYDADDAGDDDDDATSGKSSLIEKFIKNEYPEFIEYTSDISNNNVYISSLLLLTASQKVSFHRPMCTLKNDTQVYIKKFLEVILPFGKSITPDIMMTTILEMSDATPKTPTSLTPSECRPLKNFFTSPAAQSAQKYRIINERTRELRLLKAQLETERFEKTDLLEDLKIQEDKLITLQKKLDEKTAELKLIKLEKSKLMTPQSARKNKKQEQHKEQRLTKEIENLELFNSKLKDELDQLQDETKDLNQKLISKERQNETLKDKSNTCERNLELLNIQLELKNNELLDLRGQNEELRSHINNMQKCKFDADQSFEIDQMPRAISPTSSLNTSEVLSTIIDIQLQEAKEETAKLQTQLDNVNIKLKEALKTCDEFSKSQELFNVQAIEYDNMKINLENKEFEHSETIKQLDLLVDKKNIIINNLKCVKDQLCEKNNLLEKSETQRLLLDSTLKENYEKIKQLEINIDKLTNDLDDKNNKIQQINIDLDLEIKNIIDEKNISEIKMQSIIDNLQEIRSSQDVILETQSKALTVKQHEFDNLEKQYDNIKQQFINEVDVAKEKNNKLIEESIALTAINQEKLKTIENEYKLNLKNEQQQIHMLKNKILKLNNNLCELMDLSKILSSIIQLKGQNIPIDLSNKKQQLLQIKFDDDNDNDNLTEIFNNIIKMFESSEEIIVSNENNKLNSLELTKKLAKYNDYLTNVSRNNCDLINIINKVISSRKNIEEKLSLLKKSWLSITSDTQYISTTTLSACDELKHLESIKIEQDKLFNNIHDRLSMSSTSFIDILTSTLTWIIDNVNNDAPMNDDDEDKINQEKLYYENEINNIYNNNNDGIENNLSMIELKIKEFKNCSSSYEINLKSGTIKREQNCEEKLNKEKKEMKDKLDSMRLRNSKLEKNIDDIRSDNKKLKTEMSLLNLDKSEIEKLKIQIQQLNEKIKILNNEKDELQKQKNNNDEFDDKLTRVHIEYGEKLEKIKQKMKLAYNEQMTKLKQEQEKAILENTKAMQIKMEKQCKKYTEDIERYSKHNKSLSFKSWDVSEKLIVEIKEKEKALAKLKEIQDKYQRLQLKFVSSSPIEQADNSYDDFPNSNDKIESFEFKSIDYIPEIKQEKQEEETAAAETNNKRRQSVKSIQAMGNAFKAEDEEEVFDNVYLTDLKEGRFQSSDYGPDFERLSELRIRNSMCKPHLKSSYAAESLMHSLQVTEEDIKNGPITEDVFNDSLSQSLLPGQKIKKKDRTQTSYKRPGPPTPSKNGGRLSLQGNELKSPNSRVLKERNDKKTTATPKRLKDFFGVASLSKRQDENAPVTPKRRLSHLFRKPRSHDRPL